MKDNITTVTTPDTSAVEKGDMILAQLPRGLMSRTISFFIGLYYYNSLPREFWDFVNYDMIYHEVVSVDSETTLTIREIQL